MTPETIIEQAMADGVRLALSSDGSLRATGEQRSVNRWLPIIREHKPGIVAALRRHEDVIAIPVSKNARPVYWQRANGTIAGPARLELLVQVGLGMKSNDFWVAADYDGALIWINSIVLRSKQTFEQQVKPMLLERIKKPR